MSGSDNGDRESVLSNISLLDAMKDSTFLSNETADNIQTSFNEIHRLETQFSTSSNKNDFRVYDVIILGAGLSGLTAAYALKKQYKDINILILEAKDRVGGRTLTMDLKSSRNGQTKKWDLGGQWVTDTQTHVTALINEFNIETYKQFDKGTNVLEANGKTMKYSSAIPNINIPSLIDLQLMMMKIDRNCKTVNTLDPFVDIENAQRLDATNARDFLFQNSFSKISQSIVDVAISNLYGLDPSQLNTLFTLFYARSGGSIEQLSLSEEGCAQEKRVKGGTQQISKKLLESVLNGNEQSARIMYNRPAIEINQQQTDRVHVTVLNEVTKEREIYSALKVISSVPINQYPKINFTPQLPMYKRNVFESCKVGHYMKFIVTYDRPFWREKGYSGVAVSDGSIILEKFSDSGFKPTKGPVSVVYDATTDDGGAALVGFCVADGLVQWGDLDVNIRKNEIVQTLARYFGQEAGDYVDYCEKNWYFEPYNGGCPSLSIVASGVMKDYVRATREPFLNVHFAGSESSTNWMGYMDGAVESGYRVANEVLFKLYHDKPTVNVKIEYEKTWYHQEKTIQLLKTENERKRLFNVKLKRVFKYSVLLGISILSSVLIHRFSNN